MNNLIEGKSYVISQIRGLYSIRIIKVLEITQSTILYQYLDHFANPIIRFPVKDFNYLWEVVEEYMPPAQTTNLGSWDVVYN
jgi:hypothetical protein